MTSSAEKQNLRAELPDSKTKNTPKTNESPNSNQSVFESKGINIRRVTNLKDEFPEESYEVIRLYKLEKKTAEWRISYFNPCLSSPLDPHAETFIWKSMCPTRGLWESNAVDQAILNRLFLLGSITAAKIKIKQQLVDLSKTNTDGNKDAQENGLRHRPPKIFALSSGALCLSAISLILVEAYLPNPRPWIFLSLEISRSTPLWIVFVCAFAIYFGAFAEAIYQSLHKDADHEKIEDLSASTAKIRSGISQEYLKVACGHFEETGEIKDISSSQILPEFMIREIDEELQIKSSFDSLDKVISNQLQAVSIDHQKRQGQRLHVQKSVVAAGSGIFTGFFTYEVGDSILKFIHASQHADDRSLQYWLFTKAGVFAARQGEGMSAAEIPVHPVVGAAHTEQEAKHDPTATVKSINELDQHYGHNFAHHEIIGQAWLLTITIVVTWIAGFIAWHKPHEQRGGGHEHHG